LFSTLVSKNIKIKINRTIILPVVLHGYETWSLTLREEHRLRVFVNRVQSRMFVPQRNNIRKEWRRPHNEEFYALYSTPTIIWVIK
jgi:hypothetical protein